MNNRLPLAEPQFPVVWADNGDSVGLWRQQPPWNECIDIVNQ